MNFSLDMTNNEGINLHLSCEVDVRVFDDELLMGWYKKGLAHREDGPALIFDREVQWCINGERHRLDGPAVIWQDGSEIWYEGNVIHRVGGPAMRTPVSGGEWKEIYYRRGKQVPAYYGMTIGSGY